jgi:amino acid transporter
VPGFAVTVSLAFTILFAFAGVLNWLIIFTATCNITVFFMVGFAGFWSRYKFPLQQRPYKMPLWPFTPFFVMLFTLFAFIYQDFNTKSVLLSLLDWHF